MVSLAGDPHIQPEDAEEVYLGARAAAESYVSLAGADETLAGHIALGDLCYYSYEQQAPYDVLSPLPGLRVIRGNHEGDPTANAAFKTLWGLSSTWRAEDLGWARFIYVDTNFNAAGEAWGGQAGFIPPDQMAWLAEELDTNKPVLIFMHHYPKIEVWNPPPWFDADDLNEFTALMAARPARTTWIFAGHVHNEGLWTLTLGKATAYAIPPLFRGNYYTARLLKNEVGYSMTVTAISTS